MSNTLGEGVKKLEIVDKDWYRGEANGKSGIFPSVPLLNPGPQPRAGAGGLVGETMVVIRGGEDDTDFLATTTAEAENECPTAKTQESSSATSPA